MAKDKKNDQPDMTGEENVNPKIRPAGAPSETGANMTGRADRKRPRPADIVAQKQPATVSHSWRTTQEHERRITELEAAIEQLRQQIAGG